MSQLNHRAVEVRGISSLGLCTRHFGSSNLCDVAAANQGPGQATAEVVAGGMRSDGPTPGVFPPPESARPTIYGERYVISAGHPLVAMAGAQVFESGGNAVDAGVAAGLAAAVVQADMCNLGGVAPILARPAGSDVVFSVAGLGWWGEAATLEAFRRRFGDDMPLGPPVGVVPAAGAGIGRGR